MAAGIFLSKEMIDSLLKNYALTIDDNDDEDNQIYCCKPGTPCAMCYKVLKEQITILSEQQDTANPFEITDSNVEESQFHCNILSDD